MIINLVWNIVIMVQDGEHDCDVKLLCYDIFDNLVRFTYKGNSTEILINSLIINSHNTLNKCITKHIYRCMYLYVHTQRYIIN